MLFGWPTRYITVGAPDTSNWDSKIAEVTYRYQRQYYDFVGWNCHSLVASVLNATEQPRDPLARLLGGHSVISVACLFFLRARHIGFRGVLQTWGGHLCLWCGVIAESLRQQDTECLKVWVLLQLGTFAFFAGWYGVLALLGLDSQFGRTRARSLPPSPALKAVSTDDEIARCLAIPYGFLRQPAEAAPAAPAALAVPAATGGAPAVLRVESEGNMPMRVDSFGDIVAADVSDEDD